jgi:hypothetical protein
MLLVNLVLGIDKSMDFCDQFQRQLLPHFVLPLLFGVVKCPWELKGKKLAPVRSAEPRSLCVLRDHQADRQDSVKEVLTLPVLNKHQ